MIIIRQVFLFKFFLIMKPLIILSRVEINHINNQLISFFKESYKKHGYELPDNIEILLDDEKIRINYKVPIEVLVDLKDNIRYCKTIHVDIYQDYENHEYFLQINIIKETKDIDVNQEY